MNRVALQEKVERLGTSAVCILHQVTPARLEALLSGEVPARRMRPTRTDSAPPRHVSEPSPVRVPGFSRTPRVRPTVSQPDDLDLPWHLPSRPKPPHEHEHLALLRVLKASPWPVSATFAAHRAGLNELIHTQQVQLAGTHHEAL